MIIAKKVSFMKTTFFFFFKGLLYAAAETYPVLFSSQLPRVELLSFQLPQLNVKHILVP